MKLKKAAMFGLDARIALAIFGALSVISGAALYSAIQEANMTSLYIDLREVEKALEAYSLDTGDLSFTAGTEELNMLYENARGTVTNISGWKGPYISAKPNGIATTLNHNRLGYLFLRQRIAPNDTHECNTNLSSSSSDYYIQFTKYNATGNNLTCDGDFEWLKKVHDKFDTDGNYNGGKIIVKEHNSNSGDGALFYRVDYIS